jgi:hypothetical protein
MNGRAPIFFSKKGLPGVLGPDSSDTRNVPHLAQREGCENSGWVLSQVYPRFGEPNGMIVDLMNVHWRPWHIGMQRCDVICQTAGGVHYMYISMEFILLIHNMAKFESMIGLV